MFCAYQGVRFADDQFIGKGFGILEYIGVHPAECLIANPFLVLRPHFDLALGIRVELRGIGDIEIAETKPKQTNAIDRVVLIHWSIFSGHLRRRIENG